MTQIDIGRRADAIVPTVADRSRRPAQIDVGSVSGDATTEAVAGLAIAAALVARDAVGGANRVVATKLARPAGHAGVVTRVATRQLGFAGRDEAFLAAATAGRASEGQDDQAQSHANAPEN